MKIRKTCKLFLDFVYNNNILPQEIVEVIDKYQVKPDTNNQIKYDIVAIVNILKKKTGFTPYGDAERVMQEIQNVIQEKKCFDATNLENGLFIKWLGDNRNQFDSILDYCNNFFHNVEQKSKPDVFRDAIIEIISSAPDDRISKSEKDKYLNEINTDNNIASITKHKHTTTWKPSSSYGKFARANEKIPKWSQNPGAANYEIMRAFFVAESMVGSGNVTRDLMQRLYEQRITKPFYGNFMAMKTDGGQANGKVFEERGGFVFLWDEIKDVAMQYKSKFLGG